MFNFSQVTWPLFSLGIYFISFFLDLKCFKPWIQVQELWDLQVNVINFILAGHIHSSRFLVAIPGFQLEDLFPGAGFSFYISLFLAVNAFLFSNVSNKLSHGYLNLLVVFIFIVIHFAMNGRGVIAWTGWLLTCNIFLNTLPSSFAQYRSVLILLALLLASVSTGTFIINAVVLVISLFNKYQLGTLFKPRIRSFLLLISSTPFVIWSIKYFLSAVSKNVDFYGGGFEGAVAMLEHGYGSVFDLSLFESILVLSAIAIFLTGLRFYGFKFLLKPLNFLLCLCLCGGLFGYTILTLAFVPSLWLICRTKRTFLAT